VNYRLIKDKLIKNLSGILLGICLLVILAILVGLSIKAEPLIATESLWTILSSSVWSPMKGNFGFLPFIMGTVWVTLIALIIAVPLCLSASVYLVEYAGSRLRNFVLPLVNVLAAIPPVLYGVWGVLFVVPLIGKYIAPLFGISSTGYSVFSGGIMAAIVLAVSRAFGETIAVLMVCGNIPKIPQSIFDAGYPLPALIANNFGEMMSIPLYDSALMFAALLLFLIILGFNLISRGILKKMEAKNI